MKSYSELRSNLLHLADDWNKKRLELIEVQKLIAASVAQLVEAADKLIPSAHDERDASGELYKQYRPDTDVQAVADFITPHKRTCSVCGQPGHRAPNCPEALEKREEKPQLRKGQRACSICRKPGHRAKNCPQKED